MTDQGQVVAAAVVARVVDHPGHPELQGEGGLRAGVPHVLPQPHHCGLWGGTIVMFLTVLPPAPRLQCAAVRTHRSETREPPQ